MAGDEDVGPFPELLSFAGRAQAMISELLTVSDEVPPKFSDRRFDPVLFDLRRRSYCFLAYNYLYFKF